MSIVSKGKITLQQKRNFIYDRERIDENMISYNRKKIKLIAGEFLYSLFDLSTPFFKADRIYRCSVNEYLKKRKADRNKFLAKLRYYKRCGYIKYFIENKEKYFELTKKGIKHLNSDSLDDICIKRKSKWDGKWRVVIFDIPEKYRQARDALRFKMKQMDFHRVQMSVYAFPFECTSEIEKITHRLKIKRYVLIMISEIIQNEFDIIDIFLRKGILRKKDLK